MRTYFSVTSTINYISQFNVFVCLPTGRNCEPLCRTVFCVCQVVVSCGVELVGGFVTLVVRDSKALLQDLPDLGLGS